MNSGVTYYSDAELTTSAGTTSAALTAQRVNSTYGTIAIDGTTYYVAAADVARGYASGGYGIDRWKIDEGGTSLSITDSGIDVTNSIKSWGGMRQYIENYKCYAGKTVTFSVLGQWVSGGFGAFKIALMKGDNTVIGNAPLSNTLSVASFSVQLPDAVTNLHCRFYWDNDVGTVRFLAAKLELGDHQTLAHQDASGRWVLNDPPPNKALELAKCQRYFFRWNGPWIYSAKASNANNAIMTVPFPVTMRARPAVTLVRGTTDTLSKLIVESDTSGLFAHKNGDVNTAFGIYEFTADANL